MRTEEKDENKEKVVLHPTNLSSNRKVDAGKDTTAVDHCECRLTRIVSAVYPDAIFLNRLSRPETGILIHEDEVLAILRIGKIVLADRLKHFS